MKKSRFGKPRNFVPTNINNFTVISMFYGMFTQGVLGILEWACAYYGVLQSHLSIVKEEK